VHRRHLHLHLHLHLLTLVALLANGCGSDVLKPDLITSNNPVERALAVRERAAAGTAEALPGLLWVLANDPVAELRGQAAFAVNVYVNNPRVRSALIHALRDDPSEYVRTQASFALRDVGGDPDAVRALMAAWPRIACSGRRAESAPAGWHRGVRAVSMAAVLVEWAKGPLGPLIKRGFTRVAGTGCEEAQAHARLALDSLWAQHRNASSSP